MANILVTGIATLDIINCVTHYPREDEELRADRQYLRRGGNASNSCSVLRRLGDSCQLASTLADDMAGRFLLKDMQQWGIQFSPAMVIAGGATPTSYITLNTANGSRTIVHYRDLPELSVQQFEQLDLSVFDWFHFEGRSTEHSRHMMRRAADTGKPLSLEVEKPRDDLHSLMEQAGVIMFSRAFAQHQQFSDAAACLRHYAERYPRALLTCSWGEQGAWGWHEGQLLHSPAFAPARIIDTIGAGDTFNAGLIHRLSQRGGLAEALAFACRLAGQKCGHTGFDQLETADD